MTQKKSKSETRATMRAKVLFFAVISVAIILQLVSPVWTSPIFGGGNDKSDGDMSETGKKAEGFSLFHLRLPHMPRLGRTRTKKDAKEDVSQKKDQSRRKKRGMIESLVNIVYAKKSERQQESWNNMKVRLPNRTYV